MRKILNALFGWHYTGLGTGQTVESNAAKAQANFEELFTDTFVVGVTPNGTQYSMPRAPVTARTIVGFEVKRHGVFNAGGGTLLLSFEDGDGNQLFSAALDAVTLGTSFAVAALTGVTANLAIAAGEPLRAKLVSNNGGATGGFAIVKPIYAGG